MKRICIILTVLINSIGFSQKVGLVFSGGGATGFAHIGVLKALEENNIPIDFITGTSAGALVGAMYASGYTPQQIEHFATSEKFWLMSQGELEREFKYYIHNSDKNAEVFGFRFAKDSILQKSLPTNLLNPTFLDYEMMALLATNPIQAQHSFDSLFIPFRCIASDIATKESVLFKDGNLNVAVRASMTYPFFLSPISVNGKLLFDGGLYNNFPADVLYQEFNADFIIGSNVSYNEPPPTVDDVMSQVRNMFSAHTDYSLPCTNGIIIEPQLGDISTFDFDRVNEAIQIGYNATIALIDSIKIHITRRTSAKSLNLKREKYNSQRIKIAISEVETEGLEDEQISYIKRKLIKNKKEEIIDYSTLKKRYLNLYQSEYIMSIFPQLKMNSDSTQTLIAQIRKEKEFRVAFGGHFSSKPVNTGFIKLSYSDFKNAPLKLYANTYFGKFYGSVKTGFKFHLPTKNDSYIEPIFVMNRWDYFTSLATFFEQSNPSFLVINEKFWGLKYNLPILSKGKLVADFKNGINEYNYYQTQEFTNTDTTDYTSLLFYSPGITYTYNRLNRKQFESAGSFLEIKGRYVHGIEHATPGSTGIDDIELDNTFRNWFYLKTTYKNYFMRKGIYRLGIHLEGYYSFKPFLGNYTSTILSAEQFSPFPDANTRFNRDYRANQHIAVGVMNVFTLKDKLDLRVEAYYYQPVSNIIDIDGKAEYSSLFLTGYEMASASLIYHSLIGPIRGSVNYYGHGTNESELTFQLSYGFVIFNERSLK